MTSTLIRTVMFTWLLFAVIAVLNGIVRNAVYKPAVGDLLAHQISTVIAVAVFIPVSYLMLKNHLPQISLTQALLIGVIWLVMTVLFEFGAGHYLFGNSWEKLLADYNIFKGRIWIFVLIAEFISPLLFKLLKL